MFRSSAKQRQDTYNLDANSKLLLEIPWFAFDHPEYGTPNRLNAAEQEKKTKTQEPLTGV